MRLLRLIVYGLPLFLVCVIGLVVAMADDWLEWSWLHRLDLWLMRWANELQEAL